MPLILCFIFYYCSYLGFLNLSSSCRIAFGSSIPPQVPSHLYVFALSDTNFPQISDCLGWLFVFIGEGLLACNRGSMYVPWSLERSVYSHHDSFSCPPLSLSIYQCEGEVDLEFPEASNEKALQCTSLQFWANLDGFPHYPLDLPKAFFLSAESSDIALLLDPNVIPWAVS